TGPRLLGRGKLVNFDESTAKGPKTTATPSCPPYQRAKVGRVTSASGALRRDRRTRRRSASSHHLAAGLAAAAFCVISRRRAVALPPRARVHQRTMGEALKIEE